MPGSSEQLKADGRGIFRINPFINFRLYRPCKKNTLSQSCNIVNHKYVLVDEQDGPDRSVISRETKCSSSGCNLLTHLYICKKYVFLSNCLPV